MKGHWKIEINVNKVIAWGDSLICQSVPLDCHLFATNGKKLYSGLSKRLYEFVDETEIYERKTWQFRVTKKML